MAWMEKAVAEMSMLACTCRYWIASGIFFKKERKKTTIHAQHTTSHHSTHTTSARVGCMNESSDIRGPCAESKQLTNDQDSVSGCECVSTNRALDHRFAENNVHENQEQRKQIQQLASSTASKSTLSPHPQLMSKDTTAGNQHLSARVVPKAQMAFSQVKGPRAKGW